MAERLPLPHAMMGANGCFVESVAILEHWQEAKGGNARARLLQSGAKADGETVAGHARERLRSPRRVMVLGH